MAITPVTINNKTIPMAGFDEGSTYTGKDNNATQCMGFGYKVYDYLWGSYTYGSSISSFTCTNGSTVQSSFANVKVGAMFTGHRRNQSYNHTVIIIGKSSTGVTVYHANWPSAGTVGALTWTWAKFSEVFDSFVSGRNP